MKFVSYIIVFPYKKNIKKTYLLIISH